MPKRKYRRHYDTDKLFRLIVTYKREHDGNSPTLRELGELMDINSTSTIRNLLKDVLVVQGKIALEPLGETRKIMVDDGMWFQLDDLNKYLFEVGMSEETASLIVGTMINYNHKKSKN